MENDKGIAIKISYGPLIFPFAVSMMLIPRLPSVAHVNYAVGVHSFFLFCGLVLLWMAITYSKSYLLCDGKIYHRLLGKTYRVTDCSNIHAVLRLDSGGRGMNVSSMLFVPKRDATINAVESALSRVGANKMIAVWDLCSTRSVFAFHWFLGRVFFMIIEDRNLAPSVLSYCEEQGIPVRYDIGKVAPGYDLKP